MLEAAHDELVNIKKEQEVGAFGVGGQANKTAYWLPDDLEGHFGVWIVDVETCCTRGFYSEPEHAPVNLDLAIIEEMVHALLDEELSHPEDQDEGWYPFLKEWLGDDIYWITHALNVRKRKEDLR